MRLVIVRLSAIGDVVHALPALEVLRRALPDGDLTWVVEPPAAPLLRDHPALDRVVVLDRPGITRGPRPFGSLRAAAAAWRELRASRADAALDLQGLLRSGLVARSSGARRVLGPAWAREGARLLYTDPLEVPRPHESHAVNRYVAVVTAGLRALGVGAVDGAVPPARLPIELRPGADRARVVLLVGAGKPANRPPPGLLARVADQIAEARPDVELVLVGGRSDRTRGAAVSSRCRVARPTDLTGAHDLLETARVVGSAGAVVGGDTGPLHLARVLGRPVVGLFNAADPARTGPGGLPGDAVAHVLRGEAPCAPCCSRRCERPDRVRVCLRSIRAEHVARLALESLGPGGRTPADAPRS